MASYLAYHSKRHSSREETGTLAWAKSSKKVAKSRVRPTVTEAEAEGDDVTMADEEEDDITEETAEATAEEAADEGMKEEEEEEEVKEKEEVEERGGEPKVSLPERWWVATPVLVPTEELV